MRILRLIPYFSDSFGGPVQHVKMVTKELQRLGHETVVYTSNLADKSGRTMEFTEEEFDVRMFPVRWSVGDYFYTAGMKAALKREDFDLVHAHCYRSYQTSLAVWISQEAEKPLVFTAHGTLMKLPGLRDRVLKGVYDGFTRATVLRRSSRVVALSLLEVNQYRALNVPHEKTVLIHHGVDADLFKPLNNGHALRADLGFGGGPIVLFAGRIHERKGLQYLVPAFERVVQEFPEAELVICGPDYGYLRDLTRLIASTSIEQKVQLAGEIEHSRMPQIYNASDVVVLPAQYEVFGHVLAEAAACGKAIVATKWGWSAEFFEDGRDCMLIGKYGDVNSLAAAMRALLRSPELRSKLGANAREKVVQKLSWERCALDHIMMYEQVLRNA